MGVFEAVGWRGFDGVIDIAVPFQGFSDDPSGSWVVPFVCGVDIGLLGVFLSLDNNRP